MERESKNSRIPWIDIAKGYGTILVIYAHLGVGPLWTWIYSFHMPLFFFLSGYVFSTKYDAKNFIKKKCKSILVPYVCLGIPMVLFELLKYVDTGTYSQDVAMQLFENLLRQERFWTLWFIACLFCLNLLFYALVRIRKREWIVAIVSFLLPMLGLWYYQNGGEPLPWNADACMMAIPFFYAGYCYKQHGQRVDELLQNKFISFMTFLICAVINVVCWKLSLDETGIGLEMFDSCYGNPIFTYIAAFAGIFVIVLAAKWVNIAPIRYLGENSMLYYAWHQTIMIPVVRRGLAKLGLVAGASDSLETFIYKLVAMLCIIVVLTVCNWCIKRLRLQWVLGRN